MYQLPSNISRDLDSENTGIFDWQFTVVICTEWSRYSLSSSDDGAVWSPKTEFMNGNTDETTIVVTELEGRLVALHVRLHPEAWHAWPSMRIEIYGFKYGPVRVHAFSCTCAPGFSNGVCDYAYADQIVPACQIADGGVCDADVNECISNPCQNGALCAESSVDATVPLNAYSCTCWPGFTDGICAYQFIPAVADACNVQVNPTPHLHSNVQYIYCVCMAILYICEYCILPLNYSGNPVVRRRSDRVGR